MNIGYAMSSEEHTPNALVKHARRAEEVGFGYALISDHFHPWIDKQGQAPFIWSVIGAIAHATERLQLGTGVTCPLIRTHPAIIAQATATVAAMMPGRFFLGVGTGENLNEHVLGDRWPPHDLRLDMLEEAITVMRQLWEGGEQTYRGRFYTVENARLYTLPAQPPQIMVAASGPLTAKFAGKLGDGLINTAPDKEITEQFQASGGKGKPRYGKLTVCWAATVDEAKRIAHTYWPNAGLKGELSQELPTPAHYEQATKHITEDIIAEEITCGPDAERHIAQIHAFTQAGYDHVYVHQIGPDQEGFFDFYAREVLPNI